MLLGSLLFRKTIKARGCGGPGEEPLSFRPCTPINQGRPYCVATFVHSSKSCGVKQDREEERSEGKGAKSAAIFDFLPLRCSSRYCFASQDFKSRREVVKSRHTVWPPPINGSTETIQIGKIVALHVPSGCVRSVVLRVLRSFWFALLLCLRVAWVWFFSQSTR